MAWSLRRLGRDPLPEPARSALRTGRRERLLSWAVDEDRGATVVAGTHQLYAVTAPGVVDLARPWHLVDAGSWSHETSTLTVTWVDGHQPTAWGFRSPNLLPETVRERVQASVVLVERVDLGPRRTARAVIRQDLASGGLVEQVLLGREARADDAELASATGSALAYLREQVGLA